MDKTRLPKELAHKVIDTITDADAREILRTQWDAGIPEARFAVYGMALRKNMLQ